MLDWEEQGMKIRLDTHYPETGNVRLTLEMSPPWKPPSVFAYPHGWKVWRQPK